MSSQGTRVTRNGEWSEIIQDFVFGGDTILIGRYQIKMYDLLLLIEQTDSKPKKSRNDGRPKGKIERNPDTGEPILRAE